MTGDPVVLVVAPTGAEVTRAQQPHLPHTPREIARESIECAEAGATVVHVHVREADGTPSACPTLFREVAGLIRAKSAMLINASTGGAVGMSLAERLNAFAAMPDLVGLETGSINFGSDDVFATTGAMTAEIAAEAQKRSIPVEVEAFDVGHVVRAVELAESGVLPSPLFVNFVFGVPTGIDSSRAGLHAMRRPLREMDRWGVTAVGRSQWDMLEIALIGGATAVRVGFEDGLYLRSRKKAGSNADLAHEAAHLAGECGRSIAAIGDAVALFGRDAGEGAPGPSESHPETGDVVPIRRA